MRKLSLLDYIYGTVKIRGARGIVDDLHQITCPHCHNTITLRTPAVFKVGRKNAEKPKAKAKRKGR